MTDVRVSSTEFDRSPAAALRLAEAGARVIVAGPDGDRAWLVPPGGTGEGASADDG
jgi:hypothetical protein